MSQTASTMPSVVFFGSGPVAAKSLAMLAKHAHIEAVITKPSTARQMHAACPNAPQHLVSTKRELDTLITSQTFTSRIGVLIDFGIIVSQTVIDSFELGIINSHFSILPEWRGADPITFAILSGQDMTGVSLMLLVQKMDEGPILAYGEQPLNGSETSTELTHQLILLSDGLLRVELPRYIAGKAKTVSQDFVAQHSGKQVCYSRKLSKEDGRLDWGKPANVLEREIRAYNEWPKSYTTLAGIDVIITAAHSMPVTATSPGVIEVLPEGKMLIVHCSEGYLCIDKLKPAGKAEMTAQAFLAGYSNRLKQ